MITHKMYGLSVEVGLLMSELLIRDIKTHFHVLMQILMNVV